MSRKLTIDPVTRIEGHAKVHIDIDDDGKVSAATLHVLEFRGFERFLQGMQAELMPTITTRICGTCPHAHHLVAAKCLDTMFSAPPPKTALLLRQILNCGSMIHSHAIHFFALAGPDLFLGQTSPVAKRNLVGLLEAAPDLTKKALRLRSIGQIMVEIVGGRGTHPVTAVAGGMASGLGLDSLANLRALAAEALELAKAVLAAGVQALRRDETLLARFPLVTSDMGTVQGDALICTMASCACASPMARSGSSSRRRTTLPTWSRKRSPTATASRSCSRGRAEPESPIVSVPWPGSIAPRPPVLRSPMRPWPSSGRSVAIPPTT